MAFGKSPREAPTVVEDRRGLAPGLDLTPEIRLVRELGSGGMGSVWLAEHAGLGVRVAVKILRHDEAPEHRDRLAREARLTARIEHPHAVRVLEEGRTEAGAPFLVLELVEGESLGARIARQTRLELPAVRRIVAQVGSVLSAAHAQHLIHRDIKPSNVMLAEGVGEDPFVKVVDFGIARVTDGKHTRLTLPGVLVGTLAYMAPEQLIDGRPADVSSDLWALAIVAYEALVGTPPFLGSTRAALCAAMVLGRWERPSRVEPSLPAALDAWFERALSLGSADRFSSADELASSFAAAASGAASAGTLAPRRVALRIPEQLFGREREIAQVHQAFERAAHGRSRVLLVSGYSGIGKTSLVSAVEPTLVASGATFVSGKFDQFNRGTPYDSLIQALRGLVWKKLHERPETIRARPNELGGAAGRALVEVIPELEELIGPQLPLEAVSPEEARNRFQVAVERFVTWLATPRHPLVLFFDDLQWADLASIDLITVLATDPESKHVLFVGAYRDNEVGPAHPLTAAIERLEAASALERVSLGPLGEDAVHDLVSATFPGATGRARLAALCHAKTHGNAFFLRRLLETLVEEGPVRFDETTRQWSWDLSSIEGRAVTDDVVEFVAAEIRRMPAGAGRALAAAACVGDASDVETIAIALGTERTGAFTDLRALRRREPRSVMVREVSEHELRYRHSSRSLCRTSESIGTVRVLDDGSFEIGEPYVIDGEDVPC